MLKKIKIKKFKVASGEIDIWLFCEVNRSRKFCSFFAINAIKESPACSEKLGQDLAEEKSWLKNSTFCFNS